VELLGNSALALITPIGGGLGYLLDYYNGTAFDCPEQILYKSEGEVGGKKVRYCRRYLLLPADSLGHEVSEKVMSDWSQQALVKLEGCDDFLPMEDSFEIFNLLGLDQHFDAERLSPYLIHQLGSESGASHLVVFKAIHGENSTTYSPYIFDLHNRSVEVAPEEWGTIEMPKLETLAWNELLSISTSFVPNGVSLDKSSRREEPFVENENSVAIERQRANQYSWLSSISHLSLTSVQHSQGHANYELNAELHPVLSMRYHTFDVVLNDGSTVDATVFRLIPTYRFSLTFHSFLGASFLNLGYGFFLDSLINDFSIKKSSLNATRVLEFGHTIFLSKNIFLQVTADIYKSQFNHALSNRFDYSEELVTAYVRVGYYFPAIRHALREAFMH
jgi:hypothetical protein